MKLYLDTCCYNRPYDDRTQEKIYIEGEAILTIINICKQNHGEIVGSAVLDLEINQIIDGEKREKVKYFYLQTITKKIDYTVDILNQVKELSEQVNIRTFARFHLAFAENSGSGILLTTDKKFENLCSNLSLNVKVMNPLKYLTEVILYENNS